MECCGTVDGKTCSISLYSYVRYLNDVDFEFYDETYTNGYTEFYDEWVEYYEPGTYYLKLTYGAPQNHPPQDNEIQKIEIEASCAADCTECYVETAEGDFLGQ